MRVFVTGASGFIGTHLVDALLARGDDVFALAGPAGVIPDRDGRVRVLHGADGGALHAALAEARPEAVVHLAALYVRDHAAPDVEPLVRANVLLGSLLVEAMLAAGCTRFVHAGTAWQHAEDGAYAPANLYAATKQAFDDLLRWFAAARGLTATSLHLFDTYGPGDRRRKLFTLLSEAADAGRPLPMTAGEQLLDLVHVDDVVRAFVIALDRQARDEASGFEVFAVSSGAARPLREIAAAWVAATGRSVQVAWGAVPYPPHTVFRPWSSGTPLPGWTPRVRLEDGLRALAGA